MQRHAREFEIKALQKGVEVSFKRRGTSLPETFLSRSEVAARGIAV
jgi:hypothetical protein